MLRGDGFSSSALLLLVSSAGCLVVAWRYFRARAPQARTDLVLALGLPLVAVLLGSFGAVTGLLSGLPEMHAHLWARQSPSVLAGLLEGAAVLATRRDARALFGATIVLVLGVSFVFLGTLEFRERFARDLFASPGESIPVRTPSLTSVRSVTVPGEVYRLLLSPARTRFAAAVATASEYLVEIDEGRLVTVEALGLEYVDDDRLLVVVAEEGRAVLKLVSLPGLESEVIAELPLLMTFDLRAENDGRWQVTGTEWEGSSFVVWRGRLGSPPEPELRYSGGEDASSVVSIGASGLALSQIYELPATGGMPWLYVASPRFVTELRTRAAGESASSLGKTALSLACLKTPLSEPRLFCSASDEERTGLWALDPESRSWEALGSLSGRLWASELGRGRRLVLTGWQGETMLLDLERRSAYAVPEGEAFSVASWSGDVLAAAVPDSDGVETVVRFYSVAE